MLLKIDFGWTQAAGAGGPAWVREAGVSAHAPVCGCGRAWVSAQLPAAGHH